MTERDYLIICKHVATADNVDKPAIVHCLYHALKEINEKISLIDFANRCGVKVRA